MELNSINTEVLDMNVTSENNLIKFKFCNESCMTNYNEKSINIIENTCLKDCYSKLNEVERVVDDLLKNKEKVFASLH